ncbi:ZrgA family zinc uptake protein [Rheinheimera sp. NSM]|uniref:ZrgA family zinc uptake protein n=1 Tax=Rheinheimera sp. NSM TaxID=3457884 RepID=UPI004035469D
MKLSLLACMLIAAGFNTAVVTAHQVPAEHAVSEHEHDHEHEHEHDQEHDHQHDDETEMVALGAHVHGHAVLTLVLEGNEMQLAFQSAAQSIVGFEHKPRTTEQQQEVTAAIEVFNQAQWFSFNTDANCELVMAEASTDLTELQANKGHADFYANYQLLCQRPARLNELQLTIFSLVPMLEQIDIQWILNGQQGASQAALSSSTIRFQ